MNKKLITIVYDNELYDRKLKSGWGFCCLIEYQGKKILFDTGDDDSRLSFNLDALEIDLQAVEALVLSHYHWDHIGGLEAIIEKNRKLEVFFGRSFPESFKQRLKERSIKSSPVTEMISIGPGIYAGPEMGGFGPREIPLTLETESGLVIITGCAHPGIVKMVKEIKESFGRQVYLVLGGFHLGRVLKPEKIISGLKEMEVKKIAPCHCTGTRAINGFEEKFKENFIKVGAGLKIKLDE